MQDGSIGSCLFALLMKEVINEPILVLASDIRRGRRIHPGRQEGLVVLVHQPRMSGTLVRLRHSHAAVGLSCGSGCLLLGVHEECDHVDEGTSSKQRCSL